MLTVVLGGARSGKSTFAVSLARRAEVPVTFVATCPRIAGDDDLDARIERHQRERPAEWTTVEEETDLASALTAVATPMVIVDCLTTWVGSLVVNDVPDDGVIAASDAALSVIGARGLDAIVVSNEVGSGIIPAEAMSRRYRDVLGGVNQRWAARADRALLMVAGRALLLGDTTDLQ